MSLKDKIKTPDKMVDQQGAKLLIYGQAGAGKHTQHKVCLAKY